ncbi:hypothetical protein [Jatrophihabitans lederbergiae]|uniref:ParA family protein n=1 Tax=Jatrophihabitans lederbergiae TaxID=3075547 RepID=A0ABU2JBD3_9ACTN|nr:hypothetical protein [Jatrophihabitans sp. DSM 44399]MDT0262286.1 hypothetical protein [Jatrophihabitans sp. DSM 44399]
MIVTVCSDKGSPGVSTVATALTMLWPGERVLLEADPSGGDAALRFRTPEGRLLGRQPTLRGLSIDARSGSLPSMTAYAHETSLGVPVIPATDMRTEDFALIARQWPAVAAAAHAWRGTVIVDVGRLQEETASGAVAAASTIVLLIGRSTPEALYHLRERASALAARLGQGMYGRSPLTVALICSARDHKARLSDLQAHLEADAATTDIPIAGWIADDPRAVQLMRDGQVTKKLTTSDLIRSTSKVAETLLSWWPQVRGQQQQAGQPTPLTAVPSQQPPAPQATAPPTDPPGMGPPPVGPLMSTGGWS